jgi:DNA recombination protein RmuC
METALLVVAGLLAGLGIGALAFLAMRTRTPATDPQAVAAAAAAEQRMAELGGRVQQMGELLAKAQAQLQQTVNARLDSVTQNLQTSLDANKKDTFENLDRLNQRLAVIDHAQKNITELASQVTSLQSVLSNKQARGAFGQGRMEAIVQDGLPKGSYEFQYTLSNRTKPDCCVFLLDRRSLVIDAKFPLEGFTAYRESRSDDERKAAAQRLRSDVNKHVTDISGKYLIPGETYETALMFVPSESIYAELLSDFDDIVQKAYRARVVLVSPMLLMATIQLVQHMRRDARMREAADQIQSEVGRLLKDVSLLSERVRKLQTHFNHSNEDIRQAIISIEKIESRGGRIAQVEVGDAEPESNVIQPPVFKLQAGE